MKQYHFTLDSKQGKFTCPSCGQKRRFTRYIDTLNKYTFPDNVGRCDRENSCGYHYPPKQFFKDNPGQQKTDFGSSSEPKNNHQAVNHFICDDEFQEQDFEKYYPDYEFRYEAVRLKDYFNFFKLDTVLSCMKKYEKNSFTNALQLIFNTEQINSIINRYYLGTTEDGGVVFWQIDMLSRVRYGKRMYYKSDIHRDKEKNPIGVHFLMGKRDFKCRQCFFGQHLLELSENKGKVVAIVESEKSACICSEVFPNYIWLATGGKNGVKWRNKSVWECLQDHKVILFPDVDAHKDWTEKAQVFQSFGIDVLIFDELLKKAPGTQYDIADFVIKDLIHRKQGDNNN